MSRSSYKLVSLNIGKPVNFTYQGKDVHTGIFKTPTAETLFLSRENLEGDGQADLVYHGGPDKAVCVYPHEHYAYWEERLNRKLMPAAFGENVTTAGLLEDEVCIGDVYQLGEAIVQVTQPRQPCHKLAKKHDVPQLALWVQETGYTGYYFRVLQEGHVSPDSTLSLIERHPAGITVKEANRVMHHDKQDREATKRILAVAELSGSWRKTFEKRLHGEVTDTAKRLNG
ncbi:MOSC domain-containing protein [Brevibacillus ruminantium]|uniref:MOSC domain-containing protein n=1 Tax=Brevibacillus ruminantium TaxID=2950604 RepID=A0ABY4WHV6_9BACL|nr:MOSC domain-containing protein [Brevibacillus ruminantium]USG66459.1 MOSC domain-containing protein [Brevibacillus ruminantium]